MGRVGKDSHGLDTKTKGLVPAKFPVDNKRHNLGTNFTVIVEKLPQDFDSSGASYFGWIGQGQQGLKSKVVGVVLGRKAQQLGNKVQREGRLILLIAIPLRIRQEWNHRCTKQEEVAEK